MSDREFDNINGIKVCDQTARNSIPTKTSQLENDSNFVTDSVVDEKISNAQLGGGEVDLSSYAKITDLPTKTSQLTNDSGYITNIPDEYITETELNAKGYATTSQIPTVPTNVSAFTNDANYASETYVTNKIAEAQLGDGSGTSGVVMKKIDRYIYIAASNSSDKNKAVADYICTGTNDEFVIQQAVDALTHGGTIQLLDGDYYFDSFPTENACVYFKNSGYARTITIKGTTENKSYLSHYGVAIHVTKNAWDSITDDTQRYCVFDSTPYKMPIGDWSALINNVNFENMYIFLYDSQKKVTGINGINLSSMEIVQVGVYSEQYFHDRFYHVKPAIPVDTIGVITPEASNDEMARIGLNCLNVGGLHTGLIIRHTEHVIAKTCTIARCCYGYVFNGYSAKTLTLINCCDEGNTHLPKFIDKGQLTMIDFNIERFNADHIPEDPDGNTFPFATEEKGNWSGFISYTIQGNAFNINSKFWAKDAGKKFKTINLCEFDPTTLSSNTNSNVAPSVPCTNLTLNNATLSFTSTDTQTLIATTTPTNTTDKVIWSVEPTGIVSVNAGVVTPIKDGNCTITATCGTKTATCTVTVTGVKEDISCTNITLNTSTLTFTNTTPQTLTATLTPSNTTDEVIWSVNPARIVTINSGLVTPVANGEATVTATCGTQTATCAVTVSGIVESSTEPIATLTYSDFTNGQSLDEAGNIVSGSVNKNVTTNFIDINGITGIDIKVENTKIFASNHNILVAEYNNNKEFICSQEYDYGSSISYVLNNHMFNSGTAYIKLSINFMNESSTVEIFEYSSHSIVINALTQFSNLTSGKRYTNAGVIMDDNTANWYADENYISFTGDKLYFELDNTVDHIRVYFYDTNKTFIKYNKYAGKNSSTTESGVTRLIETDRPNIEYTSTNVSNVSYITVCVNNPNSDFKVGDRFVLGE